jgi:RNA polymerase-binding transcription factor DksA
MGVSLKSPSLSTSELEVLRLRLLTEMANHRVRLHGLTADFEVISTQPMPEVDGLERGRLALQLYQTQEAIEETEEALVRIVDGRFGICETCQGHIPHERLKAIPQARLCAVCAAATATSPRRLAEPRLALGR